MSSSRRRDEIAEGTGDSAESARSMFPSLFTNCRSKLGANEGPNPEVPF